MRPCFLITLLGWIFLVHTVSAEPTRVSADTRLVTFEFDPEQSYLILTRPKSVTHIQLSPNEIITTAVAGDTSNFSVVVSANRTSVLVRPKYEGLTTSLTLITNVRSYPIVLRSTPEGIGKWYQRVSWHYLELELNATSMSQTSSETSPTSRRVDQGQEVLLRLEKSTAHPNPEELSTLTPQGFKESRSPLDSQAPLSLDLERLAQLRTQYTISGSAEFKPLQVFDDGQRMYLNMPLEMQSFPAIFALEDQQAQLINFSVSKRFVVIQGVHSELLLKNGSHQISIKREEKGNGFLSGLFNGG